MRKLIAVTAIIAATVAASGPAWAKMVGKAIIQGEGLNRPIVLRGPDGITYPAMANLFRGEGAARAPTDALGPRYVARFDMQYPRGQDDIVQHLYPLAQGGPLVFTPANQAWVGNARRAPSGWFPMSEELLDVLRARGLPTGPPTPADATGPAAPETATAGTTANPNTTSAPSPVAWGIALLAGLLVLVAIARRRSIGNV